MGKKKKEKKKKEVHEHMYYASHEVKHSGCTWTVYLCGCGARKEIIKQRHDPPEED